MIKKVILEYNLNLVQKIHLTIILILVVGLYVLSKNYLHDIVCFFATFFIIIFIFGLVSLVISKKGLLIKNNMLFKAYFTFNYLILKKRIDLDGKSTVSVLNLRKKHNLPSVSIVYPSSNNSFIRFYVYLLNESHTRKDEVIDLKNENNAKQVVDFLTGNFQLKYEIYSPDFN